MKFILFPTQNANLVNVIAELPQGTSIETSMEKIHAVEKKLIEVTGTALKASYALAGHRDTFIYSGNSSGGNETQAMVALNLKHSSKRTQTSEEVLKKIKDVLPGLVKKHGFKWLHAFINTGAPGVGRGVNITLISKNDDVRNKMADDIYNFFKNMKGIKNLDKDFREGKTQVRVIPDFDKIYRFGISPDVIANSLGIVFGGIDTTKIHQDGEDINLKLSVQNNNVKCIKNDRLPRRNGFVQNLNTDSVFSSRRRFTNVRLNEKWVAVFHFLQFHNRSMLSKQKV